MSKHDDALAMLRQAQTTLHSPQPGDAAGLIANAIRLLDSPDGAVAGPHAPAQEQLRALTILVRAALEAQREYELARLARDAHQRNLIVYVENLEASQ